MASGFEDMQDENPYLYAIVIVCACCVISIHTLVEVMLWFVQTCLLMIETI